jgi:hypothetical protein
MRSVLVWLMVLSGGIAWCSVAAPPAGSDVGSCRPAELFASDNTAAITDPGAGALQDGLALFEMQADATMTQHGVAVTGSTLLDGVSWSPELLRATYERAREFHLCAADEPTLHTAAEALRRQFDQKTVLTFEYLPQQAPEANAITVAVPDIDLARFRDAFFADSAAHRRLLGGSVTTTDRTLILVAAGGDLDLVRRLVGEAGGNSNATTIAYGRREIVE